MEAVEKPPHQNAAIDEGKVNTCEESVVASILTDVCHKSNGVAENAGGDSNKIGSDTLSTQDANIVTEQKSTAAEAGSVPEIDPEEHRELLAPEEPRPPPEVVVEISTPKTEVTVEALDVECESAAVDASEIKESTELAPDGDNPAQNEGHVEESTVEVDGIVDPINDRVTFETEILVETHENEVSESKHDVKIEHETTTNILNELGQSIELSEALRSSDITDNMENNNCTVEQEVFNKEELLDILEGNDVDDSETSVQIDKTGQSGKVLETQIALQQLSRLAKRLPKKPRIERLQARRKSDKKSVIKKKNLETQENNKKQEIKKEESVVNTLVKEKSVINKNNLETQENNKKQEIKKEESVVNTLVKEWEDEDPLESETTGEILDDSKALLNESAEIVKAQEVVITQEQTLIRMSVDSAVSEGQSPNPSKSGDESLPQKRLGRIIKKKVIFDPDNPDTFTKGKSSAKIKEPPLDKDHTQSKKNKVDLIHPHLKPKSPISKLQWKKPPPKNSKQCKRLTEVDKLLMDEGAVNMIYQLTPEAPKGKKNMKTKAEFIKKLQSSTPDGKEMKFRERKKDCKQEDGDAKKILGGKQRPSLNSSVKSPCVSEDFEAHSADDSIIYRRHSSSSYSSSCMSPRRLSDGEVGANQSIPQASILGSELQIQSNIEIDNDSLHETFMGDITPNELINKDDCMSIKEKLNSKLSLALNKRKRETTKNEKPPKKNKTCKTDEKSTTVNENVNDFKHLSITISQKLAEICVHNSNYNLEVMKEMAIALHNIDSKEDVSVTLITSDSGTFSSGLDLKPLLVDNIETRTNCAYDIAESARSLLCAMDQHSKLLCTGVEASCLGLGLALVALSDLTITSESASFCLVEKSAATSGASSALLVPGVAVLSTHSRPLPKPLLNDLVVFGRQLSAAEALHHGLVTRVLWPDRFLDQLRAVVKDIAAQPTHNILLKKQLLKLSKSGSESSLNSCLEKERDMLITYWTSKEGQEIIRATCETV